MSRLLVDPAVHRRGLGAQLLEQARAEAVKQGRIPVVDVVASAVPAISLYWGSGWKELGCCKFEIPGHETIEEIIFAAPHSSLAGKRLR